MTCRLYLDKNITGSRLFVEHRRNVTIHTKVKLWHYGRFEAVYSSPFFTSFAVILCTLGIGMKTYAMCGMGPYGTNFNGMGWY